MNDTHEKIGRNDPCHCGSGKKYKKCHLEQDEATRRKQQEEALAAAHAAAGDVKDRDKHQFDAKATVSAHAPRASVPRFNVPRRSNG